MEFTSFESVEQYLNNIPKFQSIGSSASNFDLSRFRKFCSAIGNPHKQFSSIHIGGTNGKGSSCHIFGAVMQQAGYDVGLYTSPHIVNFKERFRINSAFIPDDELITFFREFREEIEAHQLTYFEITTAIAFWWFARSEVDLAVIEVGLGGRLDATNVIEPLVSVITSISLDHTDILGDSLREIAGEKGGIIKRHRTVVVGDLPAEARDEIMRIAEQKEAEVATIGELKPTYIDPGHFRLTVEGEALDIETTLVAPVQAKNIAIVWQILQLIAEAFPVTQKQFLTALKSVNVGFGRFEKLTENQDWYFDGGHNLEAISNMKQAVKTVGSIEEAILVLSIMKDKLRSGVMVEFSEFKNIYYYQLDLERAASFDDIKEWLPQVIPFPEGNSQQVLLDQLDSELVIFSGSFYFYNTVRDWVTKIALNQ